MVHSHLHLFQAPKKAKRRAGGGEGGSSNVFSMFDQTQIQEFKEVRNKDGGREGTCHLREAGLDSELEGDAQNDRLFIKFTFSL